MKQLSLVLLLVLTAVGMSLAQRTVTGTITDEAGEPLIGASVLAKGTSTGTITDVDGAYTLEVPSGATTLIVSYTGFETRQIELGTGDYTFSDNNTATVNIVLLEGVTLDEAVVTALGISREKKSLSYAAQEVEQAQLNISRSSNFVDALSGKVAGVQLVGSPSSGFREGSIRIRGVNGLSGLDPLYVLDGTPVDASAINLDNVESVSVLKGPAATALYGNRAAGGVVVVTSKQGVRGAGIGIEVNSSTTFENVSLLPDYQNEYAGGYSQDFLTFEYNPNTHPASWSTFNGHKLLDYSADESWGPRMDGSLYRPYYTWIEGHPDFGKQVPLSPQPDNVRDFFETGTNLNNNIAFFGGADNYSFRVNYNNITRSLVIPNTKRDQNIVSVMGSFDLNDLITVSANINYKNTEQKGNIIEGYGGGLTGSFNQWFQRQIDMDILRDYINPDGTFNSWNIRSPTNARPLYWDNPFYDVYENVPHYNEDRIYGNLGLTLNLTDKLKVQGFLRSDIKDVDGDSRVSEGGLNVPEFFSYMENQKEWNFEGLVSYGDRVGLLTYDFNLGGNIRKDNDEFFNARTVGGLAIPGFYNIASSVDKPDVRNTNFSKEVRSVYGRGSFGYNGLIYLELSVRNDWSSALPQDNNSYLYPMVGTSFVFSELLGANSFISFGKVRYSFAQVGSDLGAHQINSVYDAPATGFYGSIPSLSVQNILRNAELKPQLTSTHEAGLEMRFLRNRLGFDVTYYKDENRDQILQLSVPSSSGYTAAIVNAGNITREGVELQLTATPVQNRNFSWDVTFNWAQNTSKVEELADGLDNRVIGGSGFEGGPFWNGISLNARVGQEWGTIVGWKFQRDANGNRIVNEDGTFAYQQNQIIGSILPDFTGGFLTSLNYKGVMLRISTDFQKGGNYYSVSRMFNAYSGLSGETVGLNDKGNPKRDPVDAGGGIRSEGVFADGRPNDIYISADDYYKSLFGLHEAWIFDASYFKIREVSVGYSFNPQKLGLPFLTKLNVSLVGRNLALLFTETQGFDPSESERYWYEGGQLPQARAFGFNVSLGF